MYRQGGGWSIRKYLPLIFENALFYREIERGASGRGASGRGLAGQFEANLRAMRDEVNANGRPAQPGDGELREIFARLCAEPGEGTK